MIRVLIAVKNKFIKQEITRALSAERSVERVTHNPRESFSAQINNAISVIITDAMPHESACQIFPQLSNVEIQRPRIVVTGEGDHLAEWIFAGAEAAILNTEITDHLIPALRILAVPEQPAFPLLSRRLFKMINSQRSNAAASGDHGLTSREQEVLKVIVRGLNYKMAGYELHISRETVRKHVKNIYKKLNVNSLIELAVLAIRQRLV